MKTLCLRNFLFVIACYDSEIGRPATALAICVVLETVIASLSRHHIDSTERNCYLWGTSQSFLSPKGAQAI